MSVYSTGWDKYQQKINNSWFRRAKFKVELSSGRKFILMYKALPLFVFAWFLGMRSWQILNLWDVGNGCRHAVTISLVLETGSSPRSEEGTSYCTLDCTLTSSDFQMVRVREDEFQTLWLRMYHLVPTAKQGSIVHLMTLQCKKATNFCHMWSWFQGPRFTPRAELSVKQRMSPYHCLKNTFSFTESFHQCFSSDLTGTNFKMKVLTQKNF